MSCIGLENRPRLERRRSWQDALCKPSALITNYVLPIRAMLLTIVLAADAALDAGSVASHHNRQWVLSSTAQPDYRLLITDYRSRLPLPPTPALV